VPPLPDFLLVGAMKAGTTSLATWLGAHPDVHIPPAKEVSFFNDPYHFWLGVDWYREQFAGAAGEAAVGDATPLMSNPVAVRHMADLLPDARIVAVLRHPVDRAWSHYCHLRALGHERRPFERAVADEERSASPPSGAVPLDYLHRSTYLPQVERLQAAYPPDRLLLLLFDDLRDDPAATFARACRFLGVDDAVAPGAVGRVSDPRPAFRSPLLAAALRRPGVRRRLPGPAVGVLERANRGRLRPNPPMDPATRRRLVERFRPEVEELAARLGRDLSAWLR
jgi:hypothetical protein